jgi:hypothetical protein
MTRVTASSYLGMDFGTSGARATLIDGGHSMGSSLPSAQTFGLACAGSRVWDCLPSMLSLKGESWLGGDVVLAIAGLAM